MSERHSLWNNASNQHRDERHERDAKVGRREDGIATELTANYTVVGAGRMDVRSTPPSPRYSGRRRQSTSRG